jgi:hypothetical protein
MLSRFIHHDGLRVTAYGDTQLTHMRLTAWGELSMRQERKLNDDETLLKLHEEGRSLKEIAKYGLFVGSCNIKSVLFQFVTYGCEAKSQLQVRYSAPAF